MRRFASVGIAVSFAAVIAFADEVSVTDKPVADHGADRAATDAAAPTEPAPVAPRRAIAPADYGRFEALGFRSVLSEDGHWLVYTIRRVDDAQSMHLCHLDDAAAKEVVIDNGRDARFSKDGRWLGYLIGATPRPGRGPTPEGDAAGADAGKAKFALRDLGTAKVETLDNISAFRFSDDGRFLLLTPTPAKGARGGSSTLVVRDLSSGVDTTFGNVAAFAFNDDGALLAMLVQTDDGIGSGVQLFDAANGRLRTLDSSNRKYRAMTWRKDAADLAVLRDTEHKDDEQETHVVLAFRGLDQDAMRSARIDHRDRDGFPADMRVVADAGLTWSQDGRALFFGIRPWEKKPADKPDDPNKPTDADKPVDAVKPTDADKPVDAGKPTDADKPADADKPDADKPDADKPDADKPADSDKPADAGKPADADKPTDAKGRGRGEPQKPGKKDPPKSLRETLKDPAGVDVWHASDIEIMPQQKKRRGDDPAELTAWWIDDDQLVRLGGEPIDRVTLLPGQQHALGTDNTPHEQVKMFGPTLDDIHLIDTRTGAREKIIDGLNQRLDPSPHGRWFLYVRNKRIWSFDTTTRSHHDLTGALDDSFIEEDDDHPIDEKPAYGVAAWTRDETRVLLNSRHDVWSIAADGSAAERLTAGREEEIRHRFVNLEDGSSDFGGFRFGGADDEGIDPAAPLFFSLAGEWTKQSGYARRDADGRWQRLVWGDERTAGLERAKHAEVYTFTRQAFADSPDLFVTTDFATPRQLSHTNAFQDEFLWGHSELITYRNDHGQRLQAALTYPANYEAGKRYPLIVNIYEKRSQNLHRYHTPSETDPYNHAVFTAEGYFVLEPDIVYRPRNPGLSAVECVVPAVEKALETGLIDPRRIGLVGHSWGAYQTAFIVTQTDLFAAAVAGAPLTDMLSMSMNVYWSSGTPNAWIFNEGQGRMDRPFWRDLDLYVDNSPIFHIDRMNTPLLMTFGTEDGAVDWRQGVEMYNAARLAGKPLVMLVYDGEGHSLRKEPNQVDYHYRILEWFGHYLKGDEAKKWITEGVSDKERQKELDGLKQAARKGPPAGPRPDEK